MDVVVLGVLRRSTRTGARTAAHEVARTRRKIQGGVAGRLSGAAASRRRYVDIAHAQTAAVRVVPRQEYAQRVGGLNQDLEPARLGIGVVQSIAQIAAVILAAEGRSHRHEVVYRYIRRALGVLLIVIAVLQSGGGAELAEFGVVADDVDRAGVVVAPVQRSLRTSQRLDAIDVEKHQIGDFGARLEHIVAVGGNRGTGAVAEDPGYARSDAANVESGTEIGRLDLYARHQ